MSQMAEARPMRHRRGTWLGALVGTSLFILAGVAYGRYTASLERLHDARARLAQCRQLADDIRRLDTLPAFAAIDADSQDATARRIERALHAARLPEDAVLRILPPAQPYRLGDSPYQVYATRIELKQVAMRQVVEFALALHDAEQGVTVRDLRLWSPGRRPTGATETWSAEVTLTQLAFSPKTR